MNQKKEYLSILSIISSLAVVALHMNSTFWTYSKETYWLSAVLIESTCFFAVPVFLMISGANLLENRKETALVFFMKRIHKTVIPFFVWSVIAGIFLTIAGSVAFPHSFQEILDWVNSIRLTRFNGIYWYFPRLFSFYLAVPFLRLVPEDKKKEAFGYLITLGFLVNNFIPFLIRIFNYFTPYTLEINSAFNLLEGMGYLIFPLIGYYIDHYEISKKLRNWIYFLGISSLILDISLTYLLSNKIGAVEATFKSYLYPTAILYSTAIFIFFKYQDFTKFEMLFKKIIDIFGKQTFGIYLIHWFLIVILEKGLDLNTASLKYRILGTMIVFLMSWLMTYIIQKIPVLKRIAP